MISKAPKPTTPADGEVSAVFARGENARPSVRAPNSPVALWGGVLGAGVLGLMVFNGLSSAREARAQTPSPPAARPVMAPPMSNVVTPPAPPPAAPPAPTGPAFEINSPAPVANPSEAHWRAPTVVVDLSAGEGTPVQLAQAATSPIAPAPNVEDAPASADERFAARLSSGAGDVARAGVLRDLGRTVPQGTVIAAVLETAINSDLPGSVRGIVSRDVRSFDGSRVLVPRGSRLVGQYKSAAAAGQTRAFVVWTRIITPQGVSIDVASPATDRLGRGGLSGDVDTHFVRRFGASILLTVIGAGSQALANSASGGGDTLVIGTGQSSQATTAALQKQMDMPDTIKVPQGVPVQVFVARDLDFSGVVR